MRLLVIPKYTVQLLLLLMFTGSPPVFAATEIDVYSSSVVVSQSATQKEQDQAIRQAFEALLVRVSGVTDVLDNPQVSEALAAGGSYLAAFSYEASDELFTNVLGESVATKRMILNFDRTAVDNLLIQNRLPVWGAKRPDVLVVIADRLRGRDHILADNEGSALQVKLTKAAERRGIPIYMPIMDLEDSLAFDFNDVYGLFSTEIESAAERYQPDAILTGRLTKTADNRVQADWLILFKNERLRLPTVSGSEDEVIAQGIDFISRRLSEQYALILDPSLMGAVTIEVSNVNSLKAFADLERYLHSINLITQVTLNQYDTEKTTFAIQLSGDLAQLADVIALDDRLLPIEESSLEAQLDNILRYQWR